jgi:hypothetical protein
MVYLTECNFIVIASHPLNHSLEVSSYSIELSASRAVLENVTDQKYNMV